MTVESLLNVCQILKLTALERKSPPHSQVGESRRGLSLERGFWGGGAPLRGGSGEGDAPLRGGYGGGGAPPGAPPASAFLNIKLTPDKFYRLREVYIGPPDLFLFYLFEYSFNYYLLDGKSLQWSIPTEVFDSLSKYDLRGELFASPVNKYCSTFYSLFEVDKFFSSQGNFFSLSTNKMPSGLYEVNPPFIEEIFTKSTQLILNHLEYQTEPLGFIYIMPGWVDLDGYNNLKNSRYYAGEVLLDKNRHCYFQSSNNKHIMASFETIVIVIGNDSFTQKYKIANILESVKKSFTILMKPRIYND